MTITIANTLTTNTWEYLRNRVNEMADGFTTKAITVNSNNATGNAFVNGVFGANTIVLTQLRGGNVTTTAELTFISNVVIATGNTLSIGNSTVNAFSNASHFVVRSSTNTVTLTATNISVGSLVVLNTTAAAVGNSTVNTQITTGRIDVANSSQNTVILPGGITINGSTLAVFDSAINVAVSGGATTLVDSLDLTVFRGADYTLAFTDGSANNKAITKLLLVNDGNCYITEYGSMWSNNDISSFSANANATHARLYIIPGITAGQVKGIKTAVVV